MDENKTHVSLVEYAVFNWPSGLYGWRLVRFEYWNGDGPYAFKECHVWLPPKTDIVALEGVLNDGLGVGIDKDMDGQV